MKKREMKRSASLSFMNFSANVFPHETKDRYAAFRSFLIPDHAICFDWIRDARDLVIANVDR